MHPPLTISPADIRTFNEEGVIVLRQQFDEQTCEALQQAVEEVLLNPGLLARDITRGGSGRFLSDTFLWTRHAVFERFVRQSPAGYLAGSLLKSAYAHLFFDQILIKEPGTTAPTRWHQDQPYWPLKGSKICSMWLALDPVTLESGAVEYVRGSHFWGKQFEARPLENQVKKFEHCDIVPDIDANRSSYNIVHFDLEPGDCVLHHGLVLHSAPGNLRTDRRRRGYITRWAGDDVTYHPHPYSQPLLRDPGLQPGDHLGGTLFPKVWTV